MSRAQGFTLIELMVTVAIAAILMGIAIPSFRDMLNSSKLTTQTNQLVTALHLARGESIKRGVRATVCKSGNPGDAAPTCSTTANWAEGFIVFIDNTQIAGNTRAVIDGTDERLRIFGPFTGSPITAGSNFERGISYFPSGSVKGINSSGSDTIITAGSNQLDLCRSGKGRRISISTNGRITTSVLSSC